MRDRACVTCKVQRSVPDLRALSCPDGSASTRAEQLYCSSDTALGVRTSTTMCPVRGSGTPKPA